MSAFKKSMLKSSGMVLMLSVFTASVYSSPSTNISWVDWTDAVNGASGIATGKILADSEVIVSYGGEVAFSYLDGNYPSYSPSETFSGGTVGNAPDPHDIVALTGGTKTINTITFDPPVVNPVLAIWSLGSPGTKASFVFSTSLFSVQSGGPSYEYSGSSIVKESNRIVSGLEGNGTIQFKGTYKSISWTNPQYENWYGFTVGVPKSYPAVAVDEAWITPTKVKQGDVINIAAKISGDPAKIGEVVFMLGNTILTTLTDSDNDGTWTGQYQTVENPGYQAATKIYVKNSKGGVIARWPGFTVTQ